MTTRRVLVVAAAALAFACGGGSEPSAPATTNDGVAGDIRKDAAGWVEYTIGDTPLIISAPHGGSLAPSSLPDRTCAACVTVTDDNTELLARRVAALFMARTGKRVHLVINLLKRAKFDPNREVVEATGGNGVLVASWTFYHQAIESARARITTSPGRGLLLDLHGHGHAIARLELGYLLSASDLRLSDQQLATANLMATTSIARLAIVAVDHPTPAALLRGTTSLGAILVRNGYPSVPSPTDLAPGVNDEYFSGGYITERHGSLAGGTVDGIQIEANRTGVRDTPENVEKYASAIVSTTLEYLSAHYGWMPAARTTAVRASAVRATAVPAAF